MNLQSYPWTLFVNLRARLCKSLPVLSISKGSRGHVLTCNSAVRQTMLLSHVSWADPLFADWPLTERKTRLATEHFTVVYSFYSVFSSVCHCLKGSELFCKRFKAQSLKIPCFVLKVAQTQIFLENSQDPFISYEETQKVTIAYSLCERTWSSY
jgi:hypothetical protein